MTDSQGNSPDLRPNEARDEAIRNAPDLRTAAAISGLSISHVSRIRNAAQLDAPTAAIIAAIQAASEAQGAAIIAAIQAQGAAIIAAIQAQGAAIIAAIEEPQREAERQAQRERQRKVQRELDLFAYPDSDRPSWVLGGGRRPGE